MRGRLNLDLCVIMDRALLGERDVLDVIDDLILGGVRWIQYRDKGSSDAEVGRTLARIVPVCHGAGATLIVNDRVWLALESGSDGVHLGQDDMPVQEVRRILGPYRVIGCSAHDVDQARKAEVAGADYLGVGAIFQTGTKADAKVRGLKVIEEIRVNVNIPVIAVGGINRHNVRRVLEAGADAVAVSSAIIRADDVEKEARGFLMDVRGCKGSL